MHLASNIIYLDSARFAEYSFRFVAFTYLDVYLRSGLPYLFLLILTGRPLCAQYLYYMLLISSLFLPDLGEFYVLRGN